MRFLNEIHPELSIVQLVASIVGGRNAAMSKSSGMSVPVVLIDSVCGV